MDQPPTPHRPDPLKPARDPSAPPGDRGADLAGPAAPPPPLGPAAWLANNAVYLLVLFAVGVWLYREDGLEGLWRGTLVILGLGFVIFIHELGHFLTAKWCDVHVTTFSIGFGPALPGCSFQRGETTYKIGVLPLGGYVSMVGEGTEPDDNEDYPRSLKNKSVGQRMLIMSAGVLMNVIFGCVCFVIVYRLHGKERIPAAVWQVDAGSPAWTRGVRSDWAIARIGDVEHPWFEQLQAKVSLGGSQPLDFVFRTPDGKEVPLTIEPRMESDRGVPVIGIAPPPQLKLWGAVAKKYRDLPFVHGSAAAAARPLDLQPGDELLRATDPDRADTLTDLVAPRGGTKVDALCTRMGALAGKPFVLEVRRQGGKVEQVELAAAGFDFGDAIVATTDPATPGEPFRVKELPRVESAEESPGRDPFEFRRRMKELAGRPVVFQVQRGKATLNLLVPPAYHVTFGLRMKMGPVVAVREHSPAAGHTDAPASRVEPGDVITRVTLRYGDDLVATFGPDQKEPLDPMRLPFDLARRVAGPGRPDRSKWRVTLRVRPHNAKNGNEEEDRGPMKWEEGWRFDAETPFGARAPLAIPELGLAYYVNNMVEGVEPDSPAARAELKAPSDKATPGKGVQKGDEVDRVRFRIPGKRPGDEPTWTDWLDVVPSGSSTDKNVGWAHCFWDVQPRGFVLFYGDYREVELRIKRKGEERTVQLTAVPDRTWPLADRGLLLKPDTRLQKAHNLIEALTLGVEETGSFIQRIYLAVSRLVSGGVSVKNLGGPVEIASQAFSAAENIYAFLGFLGIISINLAVLNFLPIPLLDGGHVVFLIYEKLRGRPPSENVRAVASYIGLALLATLMLFVFYQDFHKRHWLPWQWFQH